MLNFWGWSWWWIPHKTLLDKNKKFDVVDSKKVQQQHIVVVVVGLPEGSHCAWVWSCMQLQGTKREAWLACGIGPFWREIQETDGWRSALSSSLPPHCLAPCLVFPRAALALSPLSPVCVCVCRRRLSAPAHSSTAQICASHILPHFPNWHPIDRPTSHRLPLTRPSPPYQSVIRIIVASRKARWF